MLLSEVLIGLKNYKIYGKNEIIIKKMCINSKKCVKNSIFFCISGTKVDGSQYISEAINNGAVALILNKNQINNLNQKQNPIHEITYIVVDDVREAMAIMSANFFGNPQRNLMMIGITGTNGKTSTSYIIAQMLSNFGKKVGIIGTSGIFIGKKKLSSKLTTPDSIELYEILAKMVKNNIEFCVMEVSAHAIFLKKTFGIDFDVKILTNVKTDHLDFFKSQKNYEKTKMNFFEYGKNFIINGDDKIGKIIAKNYPDKVDTFGFQKNNNFIICNKNLSLSTSDFYIIHNNKKYHFFTNLIGKFNLYNFACSVAVLQKLGIFIEKIQKNQQKFDILGRFSVFKYKNDSNIIIDYAHTTDSLKNLLQTVKSVSKNKNIIVIGAPGERESQKRKQFGKLATKYCDILIATSDNPASENPHRIAFEILSGAFKSSNRAFFIEDRKQAIKKAFSLSKNKTNILIVGKGSEQYQVVGENKFIYCDFDEVKKYIDTKNK